MEVELKEIVDKALLKIEINYIDFFNSNDTNLNYYLKIDWNYPVSIAFKRNRLLPKKIREEIAEIFHIHEN